MSFHSVAEHYAFTLQLNVMGEQEGNGKNCRFIYIAIDHPETRSPNQLPPELVWFYR